MKKLLELLNEYRTEKGERNLNESEVSQTLDSLNYLRLFIKRLFDNDKINTFQIAIYIEYHSDYKFVASRPLVDKNVDEDHLLMLLSIEDDPIEFLISVLR